MVSEFFIGFGVNLFFAAVAFALKSVTLSGALSGLFLGTWIYGFLGLRGFSVVAAFFVLASCFTRWGFGLKEIRGIAQKKEGKRTYREGFSNCLMGGVFAMLLVVTENLLYGVAFVASFATALADTTATELGPLYGQNAFLIPSFKKVTPGTPGAVSVEGTLLGIVAASVLTLFAFFLPLIHKQDILPVIGGSTVGFLAESLLVQGPFPIGHDLRNLLNTFLGAVAAVLMAVLFH